MAINEILRQRVRKRANALCEYCHSPEKISSTRFTLDHIQPRSLKGSDNLDNLALACSRCNQRRYNFMTGLDVQTGSISPLFNPRKDSWKEHFIWTENANLIVGSTAIGKATCDRLDINDKHYLGDHPITEVRALWVKAD